MLCLLIILCKPLPFISGFVLTPLLSSFDLHLRNDTTDDHFQQRIKYFDVPTSSICCLSSSEAAAASHTPHAPGHRKMITS